MIQYLTSEIFDPWTNEDLINYDLYGGQFDPIIYNSFHNAKIRLLKKNLYLCSIKNKEGFYKNIYITPYTSSKFVFYSFFPQFEDIIKVLKNELGRSFLEKCPIINRITNELLQRGCCKIGEDTHIIETGVVFTIVNAPVRQFLFPARRIIENQEIKKKYSIINRLYLKISSEYDSLYNAIEKYCKITEARKEKAQALLVKHIIKASLKIGLYASGIGSGVAMLMDINDIFSANESISDISDISDMFDLESITSFDELFDISDYDKDIIDNEILSSNSSDNEIYSISENPNSDAINNNEYGPSFEGKESNEESYNWYKEKEKHALEQQKGHFDRAQKALERGDQNAYSDHVRRAKSWQTDINKWRTLANQVKRS